jgi:cytidyltransferase-like protein
MNLELSKVLKKIKKLKKNKKKIVLCHGVFDLVHLGHLEHFKTAKKFGDCLVVSLTKDKFIQKGPGRPLFNEQQRMDYLRHIKVIDHVIISKTESSIDTINLIRPNFYVKGPDYKDNFKDKTKKIFLEKKAVEKNGGKIRFTNDITFSSSSILNTSNLIFDDKQRDFINKLKKKFTYNQIQEILKKFKDLKILIIGELIVDKYCFGSVIGKSGKEPHLVLKENLVEHYLGGSAAVARHLSTFVKSIKIISPFGSEKFYQSLMNKNFDKNIKTSFFKPYSGFRTITKTRFVDKNSNYKLFGSYILPKKTAQKAENTILNIIRKNKKEIDMTVICDYGHNFISKKIADEIKKGNKFIFLNAQINASNLGFHTIDKYHDVNSIIINESEIRQELRDNESDIMILAKTLLKKKKLRT